VQRYPELPRHRFVTQPIANRGEHFDLAGCEQGRFLVTDRTEPRPPRLSGSHEQTCRDAADGRIDLRSRGITRQQACLTCLRRPERHDRRTVTANSDIVGEHDIGTLMRFKNLMPRPRDQCSQTQSADRISRHNRYEQRQPGVPCSGAMFTW
jgi:hypothetical protein